MSPSSPLEARARTIDRPVVASLNMSTADHDQPGLTDWSSASARGPTWREVEVARSRDGCGEGREEVAGKRRLEAPRDRHGALGLVRLVGRGPEEVERTLVDVLPGEEHHP
jgi:hypothetical protein